MTIIKRETEIQSTCEQVWAHVIDFEKMPIWFYGVKRVSVLSPELGVGTERLVTIITGRAYRERFVHWETNKSFSFIVLDPPLFIKEWAAFVNLRPTFDSVILRWEIHYTMRYGSLGKMLDRLLLAPIMNRVLLLSLKRLKTVVERENLSQKALQA
jgi:uncharacterized membrane protein